MFSPRRLWRYLAQRVTDPLRSEQFSWMMGSRVAWGVAWGVGWGTLISLLAGSPAFYSLESLAQQKVWQWRGSQAPDPRVILVGIDGRVEGSKGGNQVDFLLERANYAALTQRLFLSGAKVVVLNLPSSFIVPQTLGLEDLDAPLRRLIQQYPDRIVIATRSSQSFQQTELGIYNHFLPFSSLQLEYLVPPEHVQGFVQYRLDAAGILRWADILAPFIRRDSQERQIFASVEALTLSKLLPPRAEQLFSHSVKPLQFNPLGPTGQVQTLPFEQVCPPRLIQVCHGDVDPQIAQQLQGKAVFVGFVGGYPETFPVTTPYGSSIPAVEVQAQIVSSMLTGQFYTSMSFVGGGVVMEMAGILTGLVLMKKRQFLSMLPAQKRRPKGRTVFLGLIGIGLYEGWCLVQFLLFRWIWPFVLPILVVGLTAASSVLTLVLLHNRDRLKMQQLELEALRRAEQEAVIDQARKLLYRVATDIHDQELQDLKVVMDSVELLQCNCSIKSDWIR